MFQRESFKYESNLQDRINQIKAMKTFEVPWDALNKGSVIESNRLGMIKTNISSLSQCRFYSENCLTLCNLNKLCQNSGPATQL